jgi:hypothetical protein
MSSLTEPAVYKRIMEIGKRLSIARLVETGTGHGYSLGIGYAIGLDCESCDINLECIEKAYKRFPQAGLYHGPSANFLYERAGVDGRPTLFWLDAHSPKGTEDEQEGAPAWPLRQELEILRVMRKEFGDLILCDDLDSFAEEDPEHSIEEYKAILAATHTAEEWRDTSTGILAFIPHKTQAEYIEARKIEVEAQIAEWNAKGIPHEPVLL